MAAAHPGGCRRTRLLYKPLSCRLAHLECGGLPSLFFHPQLELHSVVTALISKSETNPSLAVEVREHRDPGSVLRAADIHARRSEDSHKRNVRLACRKRVINIVAQIERCRRIALSENLV